MLAASGLQSAVIGATAPSSVETAVIGAGAALLGAVLGGLVTGLVTLKVARERQRFEREQAAESRAALKDREEETERWLAMAAARVLHQYFTVWAQYFSSCLIYKRWLPLSADDTAPPVEELKLVAPWLTPGEWGQMSSADLAIRDVVAVRTAADGLPPYDEKGIESAKASAVNATSGLSRLADQSPAYSR